MFDLLYFLEDPFLWYRIDDGTHLHRGFQRVIEKLSDLDRGGHAIGLGPKITAELVDVAKPLLISGLNGIADPDADLFVPLPEEFRRKACLLKSRMNLSHDPEQPAVTGLKEHRDHRDFHLFNEFDHRDPPDLVDDQA